MPSSFRFSIGNAQGKANGYSLAETTLNNALQGDSETQKGNDRQLGLPGSGQVTPAYGRPALICTAVHLSDE